jgi:hypothetical protein
MKTEHELKGMQEEIEIAQAALRVAKRQNSIENLKSAMRAIDSRDINDNYKLYRACIDYVAQHRAMHVNRGKSGFRTAKQLKRQSRRGAM